MKIDLTGKVFAVSGAAQGKRLQQIEDQASGNLQLRPRANCMISATLIRLEEQRHVLIVNIHHAIIDGWSTPILLREVMTAYGEGVDHLPHTSPVCRRARACVWWHGLVAALTLCWAVCGAAGVGTREVGERSVAGGKPSVGIAAHGFT